MYIQWAKANNDFIPIRFVACDRMIEESPSFECFVERTLEPEHKYVVTYLMDENSDESIGAEILFIKTQVKS